MGVIEEMTRVQAVDGAPTLQSGSSTITVTVVSDQHGAYRFAAKRLSPGAYQLTIRAIGYELDTDRSVEVTAGKNARADLHLVKSEDLAAQLAYGVTPPSIRE